MVAPNHGQHTSLPFSSSLACHRVESGIHGEWVHILEAINDYDSTSRHADTDDMIIHALSIEPPFNIVISFEHISNPRDLDVEDAIAIALHFELLGGQVCFTGLPSLGKWDDILPIADSLEDAIQYVSRT